MAPGPSFNARRLPRNRPRTVLPAPDPIVAVRRPRGRPRKLTSVAPPVTIPLPPQPSEFRRELAAARLLARTAAHGTATPYGSRPSRQLCLRYVMTDPIGFRRFMIPQITPMGYWHRYTFSPVILGMRQGDTLLKAGRGTGKSFAVLEPELVQFAITHPGEESMLTTLRKIHIVDRMERVIEMLMTPVLRKYVKAVKRYPQYLVELHHGHKLYGISVGDDPEAKMTQGKHVGFLAGEEFHQYPNRAWIKLQGAKHAQGCRVALFGVPDGRLETPYRLADTKYRAFEGRRFWISRHMDPHFNQRTKTELIDVHGGETTDLYLQEVHAKWGSPVWSAWSMDMLYRCMLRQELPTVVRLDYRQYREQELQPPDAVLDIPALPFHADDVVIAADIGYTQPTEAGVFWRQRRGEAYSAWVLHCRLELVNRFEHNVQAEILWALAKHVRANTIGIDCTEGEGRAIAVEVNELAHQEITTRITFTEMIAVEEEMPDGRIERHEEYAKSLATRLLRTMFANQAFDMARDEQIVAEFDQERESKTAQGARSIKTPGTVHIPEMFRVLVLTLHFRLDSDAASSQILMPQIGWDASRLGVA